MWLYEDSEGSERGVGSPCFFLNINSNEEFGNTKRGGSFPAILSIFMVKHPILPFSKECEGFHQLIVASINICHVHQLRKCFISIMPGMLVELMVVEQSSHVSSSK